MNVTVGVTRVLCCPIIDRSAVVVGQSCAGIIFVYTGFPNFDF